jgi:hypothetical protein
MTIMWYVFNCTANLKMLHAGNLVVLKDGYGETCPFKDQNSKSKVSSS